MPLSKAFQVMALVGDAPVVPASVVECRLAEVESGGVLNGSHVLVMSLCRWFFGQGLRLLGFSILCLWVRPLGRETIDKLPAAPDPPNEGLVTSERGGCGLPRAGHHAQNGPLVACPGRFQSSPTRF